MSMHCRKTLKHQISYESAQCEPKFSIWTDRHTEGQDETKCRFSQLCGRACKLNFFNVLSDIFRSTDTRNVNRDTHTYIHSQKMKTASSLPNNYPGHISCADRKLEDSHVHPNFLCYTNTNQETKPTVEFALVFSALI
jgi:hypothetical protein